MIVKIFKYNDNNNPFLICSSCHCQAEEQGGDGAGTEDTWGAQRLWLRSGSVAQRHEGSGSIDWRAVFHAKEERPKPTKGVAAAEDNRKGTQDLPGLVSKLKQKAQQRKNQPSRYPRKGKMP